MGRAKFHKLHFIRTGLLLAGLLAVVVIAFSQWVHAQDKPSPSATQPAPTNTAPEAAHQEELIRAQIESQKAQAEYFIAQTRELNHKPKSFRNKITDNPATFVTALGAVLAALFTFISFAFNYQAARRQQQDTQFFEALKRFGDASPAVRSSAAGLLAKMGKERAADFETALDQLIAGLQLEENCVVRDAIDHAVQQLASVDPQKTLKKLHFANLALQERFVNLLADYSVALGARASEDMTMERWHEVAHALRYYERALCVLVTRDIWREQFDNRVKAAVQLWKLRAAEENQRHGAEIQNAVSTVADQLDANVRLCCRAIKRWGAGGLHLPNIFLMLTDLREAPMRGAVLQQAQLQGMNLSKAQLQNADLGGVVLHNATLIETSLQGADLRYARLEGATMAGTQLQSADLRCAQLQGAGLTNVRLDGAKLFYMQIDDETLFVFPDEPFQDGKVVNWWAADFSADNGQIDKRLLVELYRRYGKYLPDNLSEVHPSARKFIAGKRRQEQAGQTSQEPQPPSDGEVSG